MCLRLENHRQRKKQQTNRRASSKAGKKADSRLEACPGCESGQPCNGLWVGCGKWERGPTTIRSREKVCCLDNGPHLGYVGLKKLANESGNLI